MEPTALAFVYGSRGLLRALRLPVARAVAGRRRAGDRVAADLSAVLRGELLAVALAGHRELDLAFLRPAGLLDVLVLAVAAGDLARQLVAVQLQRERRLDLRPVPVDAPLPRPVGIRVVRRDPRRPNRHQDR